MSTSIQNLNLKRILGVFLGQAAALGLLLTTTFLAEPMIREYAPVVSDPDTATVSPVPAANCMLKKTVSALVII